MVITCAVPKCKSGYKSQKEKLSMFKVPRNIEMRKRWEAAIPGVVAFKETYSICEKHFEPHYIMRNYIKHDANGKIIANVPFQRPRLHSSAVPTIFDDNTSSMYHKVDVPELVHTTESHQSIIGNEVTTKRPRIAVTSDEVITKRPRIDLASDEITTKRPQIDLSSDEVTTQRPCIDFGDEVVHMEPSIIGNEVTTKRPRIDVASDEVITKRPRIDLASDEITTKRPQIDLSSDEVTTQRPCIDFEDEVVHMEPSSSCDQQKSSEIASAEVEVSMSVNDRSFLTFAIDQRVIIYEGIRENVGYYQPKYLAEVPASWSVTEILKESGNSLLFTYGGTITKDNNYPIVQLKCIVLQPDKVLNYYVFGRPFDTEQANVVRSLDEIRLLPEILRKFQMMKVCSGIGSVDIHHLQVDHVFQDPVEQWHHKKCSLITKKKRCDNCSYLRKLLLQKEVRFNKHKTLLRIRSTLNPVEKHKVMAMRKKYNNERRKINRAKARVKLLLRSLEDNKEELARMSNEDLQEKCSELNIPVAQRTALKEIIAAATKKDVKGRRYTEEWIMLCVFMHIRSPSCYEFLRKNNVIPLPCARTIRSYFSLINVKCGFDKDFSKLLQKHFERKTLLQRHGVLLLDEINLRRSIGVCAKNLTYVGLTDFGDDGPQSTDIEDQATHGLVFMFQPVADKHTQPIAVFASKNPVKGEQLAMLVIKAIVYLEESGAKIHGVIADGASTNKKMWSLLGINGSVENTKTWFSHPLDSDRKVFVFSDVPHLMKTSRNRLYNKKRLRINSTDGYIQWKFFETLFEVDSQFPANARACPKITKRHVHLDNTAKMRVRLATQIFSNSMADGLAFYLSQKCEKLHGCEETIAFCKRMNNLFDALNRKSPNEGLTPLSKDFKVLEDSLEWLNRWELAAKKGDILQDEFLTTETAEGWRVSITSTLDMCRYLTYNFDFQYVLTGKINQDNLEKFFGTIRQAAGCNDHPNCPTFLQLYKLLSIYSVIKPPKYGNCTISDKTPQTPQMLVSLAELKTIYGENNEAKFAKYRRQIKEKLDASLEYENWEADDIIEYTPDPDDVLSPTLDCIIYYVTGFFF